jgi:hypothetical protein
MRRHPRCRSGWSKVRGLLPAEGGGRRVEAGTQCAIVSCNLVFLLTCLFIVLVHQHV